MTDFSSCAERITNAFSTPTDGVMGLANELLDIACKHDLQLDWREGACHFRFMDGEAVLDIPFRKSAIRAVLARIAVLCNKTKPNSVSPYAGSGKIVAEEDNTLLRVTFVNTVDEQSLHLTS